MNNNRTFKIVPNASNEDQTLVIEKSSGASLSCKIHLKESEVDDLKGIQRYGIFGILGIVNIRKENFVIVVTEREFAGAIKDDNEIFEVTGVRLESFNPGRAEANMKI